MNQDKAFDFLCSGKNIFLTGKAGTGKTYLTQKYIDYLHSKKHKVIVTAPTGIAALNIGGATIHSTFKVYGSYPIFRPYKKQKVRWMKIDTLIIDEISMVSPDYLDYIDHILRCERGKDAPFGGIQVIVVGDPKQLPPVHTHYTDKDKIIYDQLVDKYGTLTFDRAKVFSSFTEVELSEIKRTEDPRLIDLLNKIREGDRSVLTQFNSGYGEPDTVHLRPYNKMVDRFNVNRMSQLYGEQKNFTAEVTGLFDSERSITPVLLQLKKHARVMITANLLEFGLVNGDFGTVLDFEDDGVVVKIDRFPDREFTIGLNTWEQIEYEGIEEHVIGTFTQIPLKLGWCMTIHKSQGLSLESVSVSITKDMPIDLIYVALSRATNFERLYVNNI